MNSLGNLLKLRAKNYTKCHNSLTNIETSNKIGPNAEFRGLKMTHRKNFDNPANESNSGLFSLNNNKDQISFHPNSHDLPF